MAKVTAEFDSVGKTCTVKVDGKAVDNVSYVSFSRNYGYDGDNDADDDPAVFCMSLSTCTKDEKSGIRTYTSLSASEKGLVPEGPALTKVEADVTSFFASGR